MTSEQKPMPMKGVLYALLASLLFGVTTPFAKGFLDQVSPILLAGLFYLGSGVGLGLYLLVSKSKGSGSTQAPLRRADFGPLACAVFAGGIVAPVLLMLGLSSTQASTASLFLNLESVFTAVIAWFIFKENFDRQLLIGMIVIVLGGVLLSVNLTDGFTLSTGVLLIAGACLSWGIDNNFTRKVSNADPAQIACIKGLAAGITNVTLALALGAKLPSVSVAASSMVVGLLGYGVSLVLFVLALRHIGTARTGAYFSMAPFAGAAIAIFALKEPVTWQFLVAAALMGIGLWLHLSEKHAHEHTHEAMEHEHEHEHDDHHQHAHEPGLAVAAGVKHTHRHKHEPMTHSHPHFPDMHHRHDH